MKILYLSFEFESLFQIIKTSALDSNSSKLT